MKKHRVAILGFGVVGGGVAELLTNNSEEIKSYLGCEVEIGKILDLRDFPNSPFAKLVTHDFSDIVNDASIDTVMEMMGGFSVLRLTSMMSMMNVNFTKEELLKMNKQLNRMRKPKSKAKK